MGEVWLASDRELSREGHSELVALKFLSVTIRHDPHALAALRAEVLRSQRLAHPNIVRIFDLHTHGQMPFIKMEYVEGNSLRRWLDERYDQVMPWRMAGQITQQLAGALCYAHETERIVHRDIKPANLLLSEGPVIKLSDFGIAAAFKDDAQAPEAGLGLGTLCYASPQQLAGERPTPEDDIYALGVTLYELLTGSVPFEADSAEDLREKVRYEQPQPVPERLQLLGRRNDIPGKMLVLIQRCLEKEAALRPKTREVLHLLPPAVAIAPPQGSVRPTQVWMEEPANSKSSAWHWRLLLLIALMAAVVWWWSWGRQSTEVPIKPEIIKTAAKQPGITETTPNSPPKPPLPGTKAVSPPSELCQLIINIKATMGERPPFYGVFQGEHGAADAAANIPIANADYRVYLPPGSYTLIISNASGWNMEWPATVAPDQINRVELGCDSRELTIETDPPGAEVIWSQDRLSAPLAARRSVFTSRFMPGLIRFHAVHNECAPFSTNYWFNPAAAPTNVTLVLNRRDWPLPGQDWTNSLQLAFRAMHSFWASTTETRVSDFSTFVANKRYHDARAGMYSVTTNGWQQVGFSWDNPGFPQTPDHPVIGVNWDDALAFCKWLTERERERGRLSPTQRYDLPTTNQWFALAGPLRFPWGDDETLVVGNYSGLEVAGPAWPAPWPYLTRHPDGYARTAPVCASEFPPNALGFYHLGGNAAEWCKEKVLCGHSWCDGEDGQINYLRTTAVPPVRDCRERHDRNGFRVVIIDTSSAQALAQ